MLLGSCDSIESNHNRLTDGVIEPSRAKTEIEHMLRMCVMQPCLGPPIRAFIGSELTYESAPDATTLPKFPRLLEEKHVARRIFDEIADHLASKGLTMREGTIACPLDRGSVLDQESRQIFAIFHKTRNVTN